MYKQAIMREVNKLVEIDVLKEPRDAYYLSIEELIEVVKSGHANQDLIEERKSAYRSYAALTPPRIIFPMENASCFLFFEYPQRGLAGLGVSTGIVEGRARVVKSLKMLISKRGYSRTTFTDPSWTPIFVSISGLVTEIGA